MRQTSSARRLEAAKSERLVACRERASSASLVLPSYCPMLGQSKGRPARCFCHRMGDRRARANLQGPPKRGECPLAPLYLTHWHAICHSSCPHAVGEHQRSGPASTFSSTSTPSNAPRP